MFLTVMGILMIFLMTTLGAALIFFIKVNKDVSFYNGIASGVMMSASVWSLLIPSIEELSGIYTWLIPSIGFLLGGALLFLIDFFGKCKEKMFMAVTIHNMPEGLSVGLAFGLALTTNSQAMLALAFAFALGIGIQNTVEGFAISAPMINDKGKKKAFLYGVLSGAVEPIMAVIGVFLAVYLKNYLPIMLSFAAGTMVYVVADELIPNANTRKGVWGVMLGFIIMMIMDLAF